MCSRKNLSLKNIHNNCMMTVCNLTNMNKSNSCINTDIYSLVSGTDEPPLTKNLCLYQQQRLQTLSNMNYLPVGKIESFDLYCSHGLQVYPTKDSVINPSITSAIQTMNIAPEDFRSSSMNIYDNSVVVNNYIPSCVVSFEYNIYNKNNLEMMSYIISSQNDRLWISNVNELNESGHLLENLPAVSTPSSAINKETKLDASKFLLIPNPYGGILLQSSNKNFMCCMCPKIKNKLNKEKEHVCYGMGLKNIGPKGNPNCVFTLKLNTKPYGLCGYSYMEEEERQIVNDLVRPNIRNELLLNDHKIYINEEKASYTRDYIIGDYNPLLRERSNYFIPDGNAKTNVISVLVPCFTEPAKALQRTLLDLELQQRELQYRYKDSKWELNVLIICDGWFKASKSLRKYIKNMFEINDEQSHKLLEWEIDHDSNTGVQTMILQRLKHHVNESQMSSHVHSQTNSQVKIDIPNKNSNMSNSNNSRSNNSHNLDVYDIEPVKIYSTTNSDSNNPNEIKNVSLKVSVLIKRDNRRKHNSHEWFLYTFAPLYCKSEYMDAKIKQTKKLIFLTDCGTRFHPSCLPVLVDHMIYDDDCMASSGRQRVMSKSMQESAMVTYNVYDNITPQSGKSELFSQLKEPVSDFVAFLYRSSQCFDYEASISCFNGGFTASGMLPVIPGPCGLFRQDILLNEGFKNTKSKNSTRNSTTNFTQNKENTN
jgi:cellulose synthase/poly-beta-1,6-N-acetylglucosamine synthase-like glycosyltransferase